MKVLVCGGRNYRDLGKVFWELGQLSKNEEIDKVITGGAKGADAYAEEWARTFGVPLAVYIPKWETYGKSAGPIRNTKMLEQENPDLILAFPGGRGTANMIEQAENYGIKVRAIK